MSLAKPKNPPAAIVAHRFFPSRSPSNAETTGYVPSDHIGRLATIRVASSK
jgi:hypothetical protein